MVRKEGQENGIGIWEVSGYQDIHDQVRTALKDADEEFIINTIYVIGSYGSGFGVRGESDLDIIIEGYFNGALSSSERTVLEQKLLSELESQNILEDYPDITGLDAYIEDPSTIVDALQQYAVYEPVTHYYNLTDDQKELY